MWQKSTHVCTLNLNHKILGNLHAGLTFILELCNFGIPVSIQRQSITVYDLPHGRAFVHFAENVPKQRQHRRVAETVEPFVHNRLPKIISFDLRSTTIGFPECFQDVAIKRSIPS